MQTPSPEILLRKLLKHLPIYLLFLIIYAVNRNLSCCFLVAYIKLYREILYCSQRLNKLISSCKFPGKCKTLKSAMLE